MIIPIAGSDVLLIPIAILGIILSLYYLLPSLKIIRGKKRVNKSRLSEKRSPKGKDSVKNKRKSKVDRRKK